MTGSTTTITVTTDTAAEVTLVNVFTVAPERQDELIAALDRATTELFVTVPGFVSANLHASLDGQRVINYAQWGSEAEYAAVLKQPGIREHLAEAAGMAESYDPTLVRVRSVHHR